MLLEFRVQNFKCFRDEQVFSFVASSDASHPKNFVELSHPKGLRVLKSAVVYGANAAGKTTLLDAMNFFTGFVRTSANKEPNERIDVKPFLLDNESHDKPSLFEVTFLHDDGVRYQYGFSLDREKILEEWLISYPMGRSRRLFRRSLEPGGAENYQFSTYLKGEKGKLRELTRPNALFLSVGATFNHPILKNVYRWFAESVRGLQADRVRDRLMAPLVMQNRELFASVKELLAYADLGIVDFQIAEKDARDEVPAGLPTELRDAVRAFFEKLPEGNGKIIDIDIIHRGSRGEVPFDLEDESNGTLQFFGLSFFLLSALAKGRLVFIDELDTSLHPLLVRALIELFHDPQTNPLNAQLLFNTHDTTLLNSSVFRRDQIWFVEKNIDGAACLYSLLEYSPRRDEALEKGYLQGRYGAIPFLGEPLKEVIPDA